MKLAVTGGRDTHIDDEDFEWLLGLLKETGADCLVLGDCPTGVDAEIYAIISGERFKAGRWFSFERHIADWKKSGKMAGPLRNREMIAAADFLAAFPGGRGTANCIKQAEKKGIPVFRRTA